MKIVQADDVELISIKKKSFHDVDNEISINEGRRKGIRANGDAKPDILDNNDSKTGVEEEERGNEDDHYESSVRYLAINKSPNGACGFHLTRSKWDPYPWISAVDSFTPAAKSDLKAGDCVLEVNGCDVLGLRISEIAKLVESSQHHVKLLLWRSNCSSECFKESLCAAPMPRSLQRLSLVVQTILNLIECPVCLTTITPPAMQCQNGHLLCVNCRIRAEKCPVCRDRYFPRPALIAEQIQAAITSAFNLCHNEDKVRQKIFGRHNRQRQRVKKTLQCLQQERKQDHHQPVNKSSTAATQTKDAAAIEDTSAATTSSSTTINSMRDRRATEIFLKCTHSNNNGCKTTSNKFLTKLLRSKAFSMENLTNDHNNVSTTATTATTNDISRIFETTIKHAVPQHESLEVKLVGEHQALFKEFAPRVQEKISSAANTNQFNDLPPNVARNHHCSLTYKPNLNATEIDLNRNSKLYCKQLLNKEMKRVPLPVDRDLTGSKVNVTCPRESPRIFMADKTNKTTACATAACETSHARLPKAIKLKNEKYKRQNFCQSDATNLLKSLSLSMTSFNPTLTIPSNLFCYACNGSTTASSAETCNCQSSLSASTSPTMSSSSSS